MMLLETELSSNPTLQTESQSSNLESKISELHTMDEINYNSVIEEQIANIPQTNIGELSRQIQNKLDELRKQQYNGDTSSLPKFFTPERGDLDSSIKGDILSVKNPNSGFIKAKTISEIIIDEYAVKGNNCKIETIE